MKRKGKERKMTEAKRRKCKRLRKLRREEEMETMG